MALGKLPDADDEGDEGSIFAEINITPLTDVFLVMVIIFMVSALAVKVETVREKQAIADAQKKSADDQKKKDDEEKSGIKVNLPQGQAQEIDTAKQSLVLTIPLDGEIHVGPKAVKDADLDNLFRAAYVQDKQMQVVLKADQGVTHGRVVQIMEKAKAAGLTRLAIGTSG
ncbi:MAG TPA: biopolymer transporter ExbD [Kofleriaceae bacterium]|jgi:biopolymer transport protein ExbD